MQLKNLKTKFFIFLTLGMSILVPLNFKTYASDNSLSVISNKNYDYKNNYSYILGPGDILNIEIVDVSEYSGIFSITPEGNLNLPYVREVSVEGKTIGELKNILKEKYSKFIFNPEIFITVAVYRPIRIFITGEIKKPGFYYLAGRQIVVNKKNKIFDFREQNLTQLEEDFEYGPQNFLSLNPGELKGTAISKNEKLNEEDPGFILPTVYDALRRAGGVTPFSKLEDVSIIRKLPTSQGGSIKANLNFLNLITNGDEEQNIRLYDGDIIKVARSNVELRDQILKASRTNLSPDFIQVYVTGRIKDPGPKVLPQGATLSQAIASGGGQKLLSGKVEFIRFRRDGSTDKRKIAYSKIIDADAGKENNPVLMAGDIVRVEQTLLSASAELANEFIPPSVGVISIINLLN